MHNFCKQNHAFAQLKRIFTNANLAAEAAMCQWTEGPVQLRLEDIQELPPLDVHAALGVGDEQVTVVTLSVQGDSGGTLVLLFNKENGRKLAAMLTGRLPNAGHWEELERSALTETGNLLACAYAMALAEAIGRPLLPSTPSLIQDCGARVLK